MLMFQQPPYIRVTMRLFNGKDFAGYVTNPNLRISYDELCYSRILEMSSMVRKFGVEYLQLRRRSAKSGP